MQQAPAQSLPQTFAATMGGWRDSQTIWHQTPNESEIGFCPMFGLQTKPEQLSHNNGWRASQIICHTTNEAGRPSWNGRVSIASYLPKVLGQYWCTVKYQYCTYGTHQTRVRVLPSGDAMVKQWVAQDYELHSRQNEVTSSEKASFSTLSFHHRC